MNKHKLNLHIIFLIMGIVLLVLFIAGCGEVNTNYVCQDGSIVTNLEYCHSQNIANDIETKPNYLPFSINIEMSEKSVPFNSLGLDFSNPKEIILDKCKKYSQYFILYIYTNYKEEQINCQIQEFYNSINHGVTSANLMSTGIDNPKSVGTAIINYGEEEIDNNIKNVRYDLRCRGVKSGYEALGSYYVRLNYINSC